MFILRETHNTTGVVVNTILGGSYHLVTEQHNRSEFDKFFDLRQEREGLKPPPDERGDYFALITYNAGAEVMLLRSSRIYYVMTSTGQTFEKLVGPTRNPQAVTTGKE